MIRSKMRVWSRLAVMAMFTWVMAIDPVLSQTAPAAGSEKLAQSTTTEGTAKAPSDDVSGPVYSMSDLEYLLGPIALFPDPLVALVLPASNFPHQIVDADRWIARNPKAVEQGDFTHVDSMPWDASVQALARFPSVIEMLADHPDWTESLGLAFSAQPEDVGIAIQMLRAKAEKAGNLKSTPEQVVTTREDGGSRVIYIAPAHPERIYVPVYDPVIVFDTFVSGALIFGTGVLVGSAWNNRWGWNNRHWHHVWVHPPGWHRPRPPAWRPPPGRPGRPPGGGAWRPDRPGARPDRPGSWRPDRPGARPDRPGVRPDRPGARPDRPGAGPARPGIRPDRPAVRPDRPSVGDRPGARPDRPGAGPDRPGMRPDRPAVRPDRPSVGDGPGARPDRPSARPDRPATRPSQRPGGPGASGQTSRPRPPAATNRPAGVQRPQASRPSQQRARPSQGARPQQQQRARPPQAQPQQQRARPPQARPQQQRARPAPRRG